MTTLVATLAVLDTEFGILSDLVAIKMYETFE
jgi:hypothetical protein